MSYDTFTHEEYSELLSLAFESGCRFAGFADLDWSELDGQPTVLLRHDIDYGPRFMTEVAAIEAAAGVSATYCVQTDSPWYSVESPRERAAIIAALEAGHTLGLHADVSSIDSDEDAVRLVVEQAQALGAEFESEVRVVSFHMPGRRAVQHLLLPDPLINTYAPRFFTGIAYASDSNQSWRETDLVQLLAEPPELLQLLIHPFWWRQRPATLREKMSELAADLGIEMGEIVTPEQWTEMEVQESRTRQPTS